MNEPIIITKETVKTLLPKRTQNSNKSTFGNVINISGSNNYRGAAALSTLSALKIGAGYVSLATIEPVIKSVCKLCPETVFVPLKQKNGTILGQEYKKILEILPKYKAASIGCGLSSQNENNEEIEFFVKNFFDNIKNCKTPIVIDADAINIIAKLNVKQLPKNSILTPHPGELSRLLKTPIEEIQNDRIKYAKLTAQKYSCIVALKGHETIISDGEKTFINKTGNSALAKAGSGDVLTGMISGLLAQKLNNINATILAVYLHGLSGELASKDLSEYSVNATDVINYLPQAIKTLI